MLFRSRIMTADVLVIDGLGEELKQDDEKYFPVQIKNVTRLRRNQFKSTTWTTNLTPDELKRRYGEEFYSLLQGQTQFYEIKSKRDLRSKKNDSTKK